MLNVQTVKESLLRRLPDRLYLYLLFFVSRREVLHLKNPKTFSEKINWLKLYGHLERYSSYADKLGVRRYIEQKIGSDYLVPLLGVWEKFEDIDFTSLPNRFVLKATHGCGYNYICKDKSTMDYAEVRRMFNGWLKQNYYVFEREPQYRDCKPRIIAEPYLEDETGQLRDFKIMCFNGVPKIVEVDVDRFTGHKSYMLDTEWRPLTYAASATYPGIGVPGDKPDNLQAILDVAATLARDFILVRVDLYSVRGKIYFGELTFTPGSGLAQFSPDSADNELGKLLDLSSIEKQTAA